VLNPELSLNRRPTDRIAKLAFLGWAADAVQPVVRRLLDAGGVPLKNALHGTWLGHPLHPLLTDIPIGAWTVTALLDALELGGYDEFAPGADAALALGLAGALAAAVTGYADWSDTADAPKRLGTAHALLNAGATLAYATALAARRGGRRGSGRAIALAGYALTSAAAFLGGELSLNLQLGVKHTAVPIDPSNEFTPVLDEAELVAGEMRRVELAGVPLLLLRTSAGIRAIGAACTHRGAPLDQGTVEGECVRCPWHGSLFAFEDGRPREGPATFAQPQFEARVNAGRIEVRPF
jgi:nitrite reductase/ring-hydroxylating ferredoxin subunit/uncharacterized membrane protein